MAIIRQEVELPLADEQKTTLGKELADKELEWNALKQKASDSASTFRDQLKDLRGEITEMSDAIARGVRKQLMDCRERLNPETGQVDILSADGKRVLATRDARPEESQLGIPFSEPPAKGFSLGNVVTVSSVPKAEGSIYQVVSLGEDGEAPLAALELVKGSRGAPKKLTGIALEYLEAATFEPSDDGDEEEPEEEED